MARNTFLAIFCVAALAAASPRAATLDITTATIADIQSAYAKGLTVEAVTAAYLARIAAYDRQGPTLRAVIALNPRALDDAKTLDAERRTEARRRPLYGIPVLLKDNIDVAGVPTTVGSSLLSDAVAARDAEVVRRLKNAGAIILGKANLSEFAGGGSAGADAPPEVRRIPAPPMGYSSQGGQTLNPHDLARSPHGSSGGSGAAVAAVFAPLALGTDTSGSVRAPAGANGVVGLRPTRGTVSTKGIAPLALSFDTAGPMARSVDDIIVAFAVLSDTPPRAMPPRALKGARLGVLRDFMGRDQYADAVIERTLEIVRDRGAVLVDPISLPDEIHASAVATINAILPTEFKAQFGDYLSRLGPGMPKTFAAFAAKANDPRSAYSALDKAAGLKHINDTAPALSAPAYVALKEQTLPRLAAAVDALFKQHNLDAIVFPTLSRGAFLLQMPERSSPAAPAAAPPPAFDMRSALNLAPVSNRPDVSVPVGLSEQGLPVGLSILGHPGGDADVLAYGADVQRALPPSPLPRHTPKLPSDLITYREDDAR